LEDKSPRRRKISFGNPSIMVAFLEEVQKGLNTSLG
jgi:hypothetical protein